MKKKDIMLTFEEHVKSVEKQMGMSVEDFHERLEELLTDEYISDAADNFRFLKDWITAGKPIVTVRKKGRKELDLQDGEYFVPCFDPDKPVRNELPITWFYSNKDNLVSIIDRGEAGGKRVYWLIPKEDGDNRGCQKWNHPVTEQMKTIKAYSLGALIFNEKGIFGRANTMLEIFGSYAYGKVNDQRNIQGHHEESKRNNPSRIYDSTNVGTVDTYAHNLLRRIRAIHKQIRHTDSLTAKDELTAGVMSYVSKVLNTEAPGQGVVVWTGNRYNLDGTYKDDKGGYAYRYLADKGAPLMRNQKEWYIGVRFYPDTDTTTRDWIVQIITADQDRIAAEAAQKLRGQHMPYGSFTVLPYTFEGVPVCDLVITRLHPAER